MKTTNNPQQEAAHTLNSLDGIARAEAPPFFYGRLEARMQNELASRRRQQPAFQLRPAIAVGLLLFFVVMNVFMLSRMSHEPRARNEASGIRQVADEYNMNVSTFYNR